MLAAEGAHVVVSGRRQGPLDETVDRRAFLLGQIGYADFALYGQLFYLGFTGDLKIPAHLANLRAFYGRMDRLSAKLDSDT